MYRSASTMRGQLSLVSWLLALASVTFTISATSRVAVCPPAGPGKAQCMSQFLAVPAPSNSSSSSSSSSSQNAGAIGPASDNSGTRGSAAAYRSSDRQGKGVKLAHSSQERQDNDNRFKSYPPYTPQDLQKAYGAQSRQEDGPINTIFVVGAYAHPNAQQALNLYRTSYGLPPTTLQQYNQTGGSITTVAYNPDWGLEQMLDLQMASAICPWCKLVYVGATSNDNSNLYPAVSFAVKQLGARIVSMSWQSIEDANDLAHEATYFNHPGVALVAASGDTGYANIGLPATSRYVTAAGGTSLYMANGPRREIAWSGAGSGCSKIIPKPSWQKDTGCKTRMVADVSAVADPNTGVWVYDPRYCTAASSQCNGVWFIVGGTSTAAPIVGGMYGQFLTPTALTTSTTSSNSTKGKKGSKSSKSNKQPADQHPVQLAYKYAGDLNDVTVGSNGVGCIMCGLPGSGRCDSSTAYFCLAGKGYDGPTGLGAPSGGDDSSQAFGSGD